MTKKKIVPTRRRLKWILWRIFLVDKYYKVVVAGDFNRISIKELIFLESHFHITPVLNSQEPTHKAESHLDNIWTNLTITGS